MIARILLAAGALIFLVLGTMHLAYTFFFYYFLPRDQGIKEGMEKTNPVLTRRTTMWNAWIGFNASHSSGAMFIGGINLIMAVSYFDIYGQSPGLQLLNILTAFFYLFLARRYWFNIPFRGVLLATICFTASSLILFFYP